jgi:oxygen-dependent protoporphyrinogen oxidase
MKPLRVLVIGGGITGLAAAYYLHKQAAENGLPLHLTVVEKDARWGGKITTERLGGFVIEGGPDTFLATKPWGVSICRELGLEGSLQGTNPAQRKTYVLHNGRLHPLPDGLTMMIPTRLSPMARTSLLSWPQKARMGMDYFLPPAPLNGDESLGDFVSRRLGRAAYERLIEPLMSGIYAGDGDQLSLRATFPALRDLELKHGGLVRGALAARQGRNAASSRTSRVSKENDRQATGSRSVFLTPLGGLAEMVEALAHYLEHAQVTLRSGTAVVSLAEENGAFSVRLESG